MKTPPTPDELEPEIEPSEHTRPGPLADEKKVNKARDREKLARMQETIDLQTVMATPAGRRLMSSILRYSGVDTVAFRSTDRDTTYVLGLQRAGDWLVSRMRRDCIDLMRLMEDEESVDERNRD